MAKADEHPGAGQESAETRNAARIQKAFQLFDELLPDDQEWSHEGAAVITITSNNPRVDGEAVDQKAATFDARFAATKTFFDDRHVPRKIELFKYKVMVTGEDGQITSQLRRHFKVSRADEVIDARGSGGKSITYVLHEPNATSIRKFPRRLEVGASMADYDANGALSSVAFEKMTITDGEELVTALDCLSRACGKDPDAEVGKLRLTADEIIARRDKIRLTLASTALRTATARRRRPSYQVFTSEEDAPRPPEERERRLPTFDEQL